MNFDKNKLTEAQRTELADIAKRLGKMWMQLETAPDETYESGNGWYYRGGLFKLTFKGGFTDGWADLEWNQVIADIYQGSQFAHLSKTETYHALSTKLEQTPVEDEETSDVRPEELNRL